MSVDKETPPIVFRYEERIAELEKENEQLKTKLGKFIDRVGELREYLKYLKQIGKVRGE